MKEPLYTVATLLDPWYWGKLLPANELDAATSIWHSSRWVSTMRQVTSATAWCVAVRCDAVRRRWAFCQTAKIGRCISARPVGSRATGRFPSDWSHCCRWCHWQANTQHQLNSLECWKHNEMKYRHAADVARCYLSHLSTPVACERLFSSAGDLYSDSHNHLSRHRADMLLFIKHNL